MKKHTAPFLAHLLLLIFACSLSSYSQVWNRQVADSSGINIGLFCKIAIDKENNPFIVHMDADYKDLMLMQKIDGQWTGEKIDTSGYTGWSPGMVFDSKGIPHFCFDNGAILYDQSANFGVNYMTHLGDAWVKEKIEQYEIYVPQHSTSIALTSDDQPVIGYWNQNEELYTLAWKREGEWVKELSPYEFPAVRLRLKSDDTPVVLLYNADSLVLATYTEGTDTWTEFPVPIQLAPTLGLPEKVNFLLDKSDQLHLVVNALSYATIPFTYHVMHYTYDWQSWEKDTVTSYVFETPMQIALDNEGNPAVLTFAGSPRHLSFFTKKGDEWTGESVDMNCEKFMYADVQFDGLNRPHIALQDIPEDIDSEKEQMLIYYHFSPGLPDLNCHPPELNFEEVWTESYRALPLYIRNDGVAALIIGEVELSNTEVLNLEGPGLPAFIQPGDSVGFTLEYHPSGEESISENLRFVSNDPVNPVVDIPVFGSGVTTGTSSTLTLNIKNIYADFDNLVIDEDDPLKNVEVTLHQAGQLTAGAQFTNAEGNTAFDGLSPGTYQIKLLKAADGEDTDMDCSRIEEITLGPGHNSVQLELADSLFHYQVWLKNKLQKIRETDNLMVRYLNYSNAMNKVSRELAPHAEDFDPEYTESLARLLLVEYMVSDLFEEGYQLGDEMFKDFGELIAFIFYSNDWAARILDLFLTLVQAIFEANASDLFQEIMQMLLEELIKNEVHDLVSESLMLVGGEIGPPADDILLEAWRNVWKAYSSGWNFSFGMEEWGRIIMKVKNALEEPFIQEVYIEELTAPSIRKGLNYTLDNAYNGSFFDAIENEINYVSHEKNTVEMSLDAAVFFRQSGELLMVTASIFNWLGTLDFLPYSQIIDQVGFYMKMTAYMEVVTALGISTGKFFVVPSNMEKTVNKIYFPDGKPGKSAAEWQKKSLDAQRADHARIGALKTHMQEDNEAYASVLEDIKTKIQSGNRMDAAGDILRLREADKKLKNSFLHAASPVIAVANIALDTLESFNPMWDSLKVCHARAGQERFLTYFRLLLAIGDTTGDSDALMVNLIDENLTANQEQNEQIAGLLDLVSDSISLPAVLVASVTATDRQSLALNDASTVKLVMTNTGAVAAEGVYLKINYNEALELSGSDSIYIGSIAPGETSAEIALTFTCINEDLQLATWYTTLASDNARTLPCSGSYNLKGITHVRPPAQSPRQDRLQVIPNPLSEAGEITYRLVHRAKVRLSLYELSGRVIRVFTEVEQEAGTHRIPFDTGDLAPGVYYLVLEIDGSEHGVEKVILR